jgi:Holliday junction resolvase-like predicted endonuclease
VLKNTGTSSANLKGQASELIAKKFYENQGYVSVSERFRSRFGEIDLILWHSGRQVLRIVEVKTQPDEDFFEVRWSLPQRRRFTRFYLALQEEWPLAIEMDLIFVDLEGRIEVHSQENPLDSGR